MVQNEISAVYLCGCLGHIENMAIVSTRKMPPTAHYLVAVNAAIRLNVNIIVKLLINQQKIHTNKK